MALERKDLRAILEDETVDVSGKMKKILDMLHTETDALQNQLDDAKAATAKAEKERDEANGGKQAAEKALTDYKAQQTAAASKAAKTAAFKQLLKQAGVLEKYIDDIADDSKKGDEFAAGLELDADGKVKNAEKQLSSIKTAWGSKIATTTTTGAKVDNPPTNTGSKMTREQIINIKDASERQAAIAANPEAFGLAAKE
jgi:hypothetical protein